MNDCIYNYADDNTISVINENIQQVKEILSTKSSHCMRWFSDNMMKANPLKFQFMLLDRAGISDSTHELVIDDVCLKSVNCVKLLGVNIDCNLIYVDHVNQLCKKAS
jgi:hypothetical protein